MGLKTILSKLQRGDVFCMTDQRKLGTLAEIVDHANKVHWLLRKK